MKASASNTSISAARAGMPPWRPHFLGPLTDPVVGVVPRSSVSRDGRRRSAGARDPRLTHSLFATLGLNGDDYYDTSTWRDAGHGIGPMPTRGRTAAFTSAFKDPQGKFHMFEATDLASFEVQQRRRARAAETQLARTNARHAELLARVAKKEAALAGVKARVTGKARQRRRTKSMAELRKRERHARVEVPVESGLRGAPPKPPPALDVQPPVAHTLPALDSVEAATPAGVAMSGRRAPVPPSPATSTMLPSPHPVGLPSPGVTASAPKPRRPRGSAGAGPDVAAPPVAAPAPPVVPKAVASPSRRPRDRTAATHLTSPIRSPGLLSPTHRVRA